MANNVNIGPNVIVAYVNQSFVNAGLVMENTDIIYRIGSPNASWKPERVINGVTGFEAGFGYYLIAKQPFDLTDYTVPPVSTD